MPVGMNHDVNEVGIVERRSSPLVGVVGEVPARRPLLPQVTADLMSIRLQPGTPALGVEVVLIPESVFGCRRTRRLQRNRVLNGVAADQHRRPYAIRVKG